MLIKQSYYDYKQYFICYELISAYSIKIVCFHPETRIVTAQTRVIVSKLRYPNSKELKDNNSIS